METQRCGHCREDKPLDEFVPSYRGRPGTWCRACHRAAQREHYVPKRPRRPDDVPGDHSWCTRCQQARPLDEFYRKRSGVPREWCKQCYRDYHRESRLPKSGATDDPRECAQCGKTYRPRTRRPSIYCSPECNGAARTASGRQRRSHLKVKFGITPEDYGQMLAAQGDGCAICGNGRNRNSPSREYLHIDHDHETGRVRGILCDRCNQVLGHFGDDPALLRRAADYLEGR